MAEHPNVALIRKGYEAFAKADMAALTGLFADDVVWHLPGNNQLSGEHKGRDAVFAVFVKTAQLTGGTFKIDLHDVLASDDHAVALQRVSATRGGKRLAALNAEVYHIVNGKVKEWWSFSDSTDQENDFWS